MARRAAAVWSWAALLAVAASGCFDPTFPDAKIACQTTRDCPSGLFCSSGLCYHPGAGGAASDEPGGPGGTAGMGGHGGAAGAGGVASGGHPGLAGSGGAAGHPNGGAAGGGPPPGGAGGPASGGAGGLASGGAGGLASGGAGGSCQAACTLGAARCGSAGLETCVSVGGCPTWGTAVACSGRKTCQGSAPSAACVCPAPPAGCTGAGTACVGGALVTCAADGDGCVVQSGSTACAANEPCGGAFPKAACTCPAAPAVCNGKAGTFCDGSSTQVVTCALDAAQCLVIAASATCAHGCSGAAGSATCGSCPAPPSECAAAGMLCTSGGDLETCGLDSSGCLTKTAVEACAAPTSCGGAFPGASCACPAVPSVCAAGAGTTCASDGITVVTCGMVSGCLVQTAANTCASPQVCGGNATVAGCTCPAVAACQAGAGSYCDGGGNLITCATAGGCLAASSNGCGGGQVCGGSFPSAACSCPAPTGGCGSSPGTSCAGDTAVRTCSTTAAGCIQGQTSNCASGQYCWTSTAKCAAPTTAGYASDLGATASLASGYLSGEPVTMAGAFTLRGFGLIANAASGGVSVGLYTDLNGLPSKLVAKAQDQSVILAAPNKNEYPASPAAGGSLTLPAGTYWIMAGCETSTTVRAGATGGATLTFAVVAGAWSPLPATLSGVGTLTRTPINLYLLITQ